MKPSVHTMTAEEYHADPTPAPSLSASIAVELLHRSPRHAWFAHPKLNPDFVREESETFDLGTAAHAYLLEGGKSRFAIIDAPDWRTKAAKEARDAARSAGQVPLLAKHWADVQAMTDAAKRQLVTHAARPRPFTAGLPEQTLVWQEGPVWCRARLDWLHDDRRAIDDLKTTAASANPEAWSRSLFGAGYDIQAAFYLRGLRAVCPGAEPVFRFVVVENFAPFALSVIGLTPEALTIGEKKVLYALETWQACLESGQWPGYPTRVCYAQLPPWEEARWLERELRDETTSVGVHDDGSPIGDLLARGTA